MYTCLLAFKKLSSAALHYISSPQELSPKNHPSPLPTSHPAGHTKLLPQLLRQRQGPRRASHIHRLRGARDDPVLRNRVPVRDVTAGDLVCELLGLSGVNGDVIKASENNLGVVFATEGDVL